MDQIVGTTFLDSIFTWRGASPFLLPAALWGLVTLGAALLWGNGPVSVGWAAAFWALSIADLAVLARAVLAVLALGGNVPANKRPALVFQALFWGGAKVACLGFILVAAKIAGNPQLIGIFAGLATMVIVPLTGGYYWSRKELENVSC